MTNTPQPRSAQQVREDYWAERQRRLAGRQGLPPPVIPADAFADVSDGTLNKDVLKQDLAITMPKWANTPIGSQTSACDLMWVAGLPSNPPPEASYQMLQHVDIDKDTVYPVPLTIPQKNLVAGSYLLCVRIIGVNGSAEWTSPIPLICDSEPPYEHAAPLPLGIPPENITDKYLADNGDQVNLLLPEYLDFQAKDQVRYYWGTVLAVEGPVNLPPVATLEVKGPWPMPLPVSKAHIEAVGDGGCYVMYELIDKATNVSHPSTYERVAVALGALPVGMTPPAVRLADDGFVDKKDVDAGVVVDIPAFTNWKSTDSIVVTWGTTELEPEPVGSAPGFPLEVLVPAAVIAATYAATTGPMDTKVSYIVRRGDVDSVPNEITIKVDLWAPGPPNPDWPDPINTTLAPAVVMGEKSQVANTLTRADKGLDAELSFVVYTDRADGDVIKFYWANKEVVEAQYTLTSVDLVGNVIKRPLYWATIESAYNNAALPLQYEITLPGVPNSQMSPVTPVNADAIELSPPAPEFEGMYNNEMLTCDSLYAEPGTIGPDEPAIRVRVPDLSGAPYSLVKGDKIVLSWIAKRTSGAPVTGTELTADITLDDEHPPQGFIWKVQPYATHIAPSYLPPDDREGLAVASYSYAKSSETINSQVKEVRLAMFMPSSGCQLLQP